MTVTTRLPTRRNRQTGAALIIGLMLLVVITTLAVSGMNTATTELALARNDQNYEFAFQAAETGLEQAMAQGSWNTTATMDLGIYNVNVHDQVHATVNFENATFVPDRGFSMGVGSGVSAYHFLATSQAASRRDPGNTTDRDSTALHTQAFYIVGPASSSL